MAPIQNARVLFNSVPEKFPMPGGTTVYDTTQTIDLKTVPLDGGFLIKTLILSVDQYFRNRMRKPEKKSFVPPFELGASISGYGVGRVLRSENSAVEVGKYVYGPEMLHQEYAVMKELGPATVLEKHPDLPWTVYVGAAGMPGQTAFTGWKEYSDAKPGEVAFVTTGAGPVGSMVIQLAKQAGLKVIASAGSEEKVKFMQSLGADVVFNYKTMDTREVLAKEGPIDIFWDNVGGDILDAAIEHAAIKARFLECGSSSGYNNGHTPIKNMSMVSQKTLHIHGILVFQLLPKYYKEFYGTIPAKLASEEIKYNEEVTNGLDKVEDVILAVQKGTNRAKAVVVVAEE
ncbi:hypothetical protein B0H16DRAFT_1435019 [Mycena metata]|uniref:Enoyl reductase (ER) domain-containing protein n=1 Tax=Mycena metata TaxID=1033252 RepID=A0AAD7HA00_9AGAR|nr:hypothetical protein B0H16DRAFT_1435019 [Mycena metata]